jgi:hypothetical protein
MSGVLNKIGTRSGRIWAGQSREEVSGGGGGGISTHTAIADGALSNGDRVILQADGKVKIVGQSGGGALSAITTDGQETDFGQRTVDSGPMIEYDPYDATKFAMLYIEKWTMSTPTPTLMMVIGNISGTTITFGTAVNASSQNASGLQFTSGMWPAFQWHPRQANLIVITYGNTNGAQASWGWRICAGTVSGTTITMGFDDQLGSITNSVAYGRLAICCKVDTTDSQLPALTYSAAIMTFDGMSGIGAVMQVAGWIDSSGTSGTHGTPISVHSSQWNSGYYTYFQPWMRFDPNDEQKVALFYEDPTSSPNLKPVIKIQTITNNMGTPTITQGAAQVVDSYGSGRNKQIEWRKDVANSFILSWLSHMPAPVNNEMLPCFIVGTVSGTSVSFGSKYMITTTLNMQRWDILISSQVPYDAGTGGTTFFGIGEGAPDSAKMYGKVFKITNNMGSLDIQVPVGGTTMLQDPMDSSYSNGIADWDGDSGSHHQSCTNGTEIITRAALGNSFPGDHIRFSTGDIVGAGATNLTAVNFLGIADGAYADGATATIQLSSPSIDDSQSGLTPGSTYYVQENGSLSTTPATPSVLAGLAISATQLLIKG